MAWTSGFFNSSNGDRLYNADQLSAIFNGLITDGVYQSIGNKLAVQPNSGMTIQINTGRGWFAGKWVDNNSPYLLNLEASDVTLNRYVAVGVKVDVNSTVRTAVPFVKYSSFATNPAKPTAERSEKIKEYILAYVYIKAGASSITASNIEDTRANTSLCGWVTGLIDQVNSNTLWTQWEAMFNEWFDTVKGTFSGDAIGNLQSQINAVNATAERALDVAYTVDEMAYDTDQAVKEHVGNANNPHSVTKSQVGLGDVKNVEQMPISGGTFTGIVVAQSTNRNPSGGCVRNSVVVGSGSNPKSDLVSTNCIIFSRS